MSGARVQVCSCFNNKHLTCLKHSSLQHIFTNYIKKFHFLVLLRFPQFTLRQNKLDRFIEKQQKMLTTKQGSFLISNAT
jgi:hypothetical protein